MLNLNYNINKAIGGGGCIGVMKYNYSASIAVYGGGGGGATDTQAGGGGGGSAYLSRNISIIPNLTYQINVGGGGAVDNDGQDSSLVGWDDNDTIPIQFYAGGGRKGLSDGTGGNSGTGSIVREGTLIATSTLRTGGNVYSIINSFGLQKGAGGGASNSANGFNGRDGFGGNGGNGNSAGGGGGAFFNGSTGPYGNAGGAGSGLYGVGGNGYSSQTNGVSTPRAATAGTNGAVVISYPGKTKATVTNATTTFVDGNTIHTFNSGSGTFIYNFPFPYDEPATPYQVVLCPPTYR